MQIGTWTPGSRVFVIAEIGPNHNGDFDRARALIRQAAEAGADAVKFQRYHGEELVQRDLPTMAHVRGLHRTQRERFWSLQFTDVQWATLAGDARAAGVAFFASTFDERSADAMDPLMPAFKIASGDLTHRPLLRHIAKKGKPIVLSTGMATVEEIAEALEVLPLDRVVLLHCVSRYPTPAEAANLRAIPFLARRFGLPVGYSDHTIGITACLAAVALGAVMIEKHFTDDKTQPIGDHKLSAEPPELAEMVRRIREIEVMLGQEDKPLTEAEIGMRNAMRRSLYARRDLPAGHALDPADVAVMRPAVGLPPAALDGLVGRVLRQAVAAETPLRLEDFREERR